MQLERNKKYIIVATIAAIVFATILLIVFWNLFHIHKETLGKGPFVLYFVLFFILIFLLGSIFKITSVSLDPKLIKSAIKKEVSEERIKILKEFEKKEQEKENTEVKESLLNRKDAIIPKGNFKNLDSYLDKLFKNIIKELEFVQGIGYLRVKKTKNFEFQNGFALTTEDVPPFKEGENLPGQVAETKEMSVIDEIPDDYFSIESGLGSSKPKLLLIVPVLVKDTVIAVFEFASFKDFDESDREIIQKVFSEVSNKIEQLYKA
jgi:putative methionine-R-sulfoxide reductase with GAF domain